MPKIRTSARRALTEERRKQILDAAAQVFAQKGFDRATIADIAHTAGIAEGSIYNYFKNKNDLLVSLPRQMIEPTIKSMSARMLTPGVAEPFRPEQFLTMVARNIVGAIQQNAPIFRALVSALPSMKQPQREKYLNQVVLYATGMLESYFSEQIKQGIFCPNQNPRVLARAFVGMFFPYVIFRELLQIETETDWTYDQIIAEIVPLFLRGVLSDSVRAPSKQRQKISVE